MLYCIAFIVYGGGWHNSKLPLLCSPSLAASHTTIKSRDHLRPFGFGGNRRGASERTRSAVAQAEMQATLSDSEEESEPLIRSGSLNGDPGAPTTTVVARYVARWRQVFANPPLTQRTARLATQCASKVLFSR